MKTAALIIHLKRATKRGEHVEKLIKRLPIKAEILNAVDAMNMTPGEIDAVYARSLRKPYYPFELRPSEIACFQSHRKAWATIVERNLDAGLVIEDDVDIDDGPFAEQLALALEAIQPGDYIRFPRWTRGEHGTDIARNGTCSIMQPRLPGLGMQMQLVGREAAAELLKATERFDRPVDTTIQMRWLHTARILSARPITIREIDFDLGGTVVQGKNKSFGARLKREILRPYYRVALNLYSRTRRT
ncbi:glycosyltransferase family 25 protein [Phyllobacterium sp. BT25]|uniref:Glycosyltransferase family 25 protein n=1 Tax=Phyllobacterium pellucidum TaxID=2740464 RepID=A0A849VSL1_9HYPH|nr:glycosyltransferase family 25 protein [Phyllobacterium sp. T1018]NTS31944.1 glycosyltransferase family 25 protein [Phyllobacterium pellucidum]UGY09383.1 glycosyltransferase family 25 protein [Phyllobacterium sp. T1018]